MANDNKNTTRDTVYNVLYENITKLRLKPGTLMSEKDISEKFNLSRTPVREAFIKLSNLELVNIVPQKVTMVAKIDLDRVREERFLREAIEVAVLEDFVKKAKPRDIIRLEKNLEQQQETIDNGDNDHFFDLDREFHHIIFSAADLKYCYRATKTFYGHYDRVRHLSLSIMNINSIIVSEHVELVKVLKEKDIEKAQKKLKEHLRRVIVEEDILTRDYPDFFLAKSDNIDYDKLF